MGFEAQHIFKIVTKSQAQSLTGVLPLQMNFPSSHIVVSFLRLFACQEVDQLLS